MSALAASAIEMPTRKAGLWEMKMVRTGSPMPDMTMQHCTDETTDKAMSSTYSPMSKDMCSKNELEKTATGYTTDLVCTVGGISVTSHSETNRRFQFRLYGQGYVAQPGRPVRPTRHGHDGGSQVARRLQGRPEAR